MATIRLLRPFEQANRLAAMTVYIDGRPAATLINDDRIELPVPPGRHRLWVRIDSQGSRQHVFNIRDKATKTFVLSTADGANRPEPFGSGLLLADLLVNGLILLYYFTIGHNRYLHISEQKAPW